MPCHYISCNALRPRLGRVYTESFFLLREHSFLQGSKTTLVGFITVSYLNPGAAKRKKEARLDLNLTPRIKVTVKAVKFRNLSRLQITLFDDHEMNPN